MEQYEACKTPQRFVKKAGVYSDHTCSLAHHSPWEIGFCAECLLIHKVAPSSYSLSEQKSNHCDVENRHNLHFLKLSHSQTACKRTYNSSVDCETSVVYVENLNRILTVIIPLEQAIIQSCADNARYNSDQNTIYKPVEINIISRRASPRIGYCKQESAGDYKSVPIYRVRADTEGYRINCKIKSQAGEAYMIFHTNPPCQPALQQKAYSCIHRAFLKVCC